jgi:hypothetical protein
MRKTFICLFYNDIKSHDIIIDKYTNKNYIHKFHISLLRSLRTINESYKIRKNPNKCICKNTLVEFVIFL